MKKCSKCKKDFYETYFHWRNKSRNLRSSWCKGCISKRTKDRHRIDPQYFRNKNKERRKRLRRWLNEIKSKPCMDCKGVFPPCCMDFDHKDRKKKSGNIAKMLTEASKTKVLKEIEKCDLVCANCHRIRTQALFV